MTRGTPVRGTLDDGLICPPAPREDGALKRIRTSDLPLRRGTLCPAELSGRAGVDIFQALKINAKIHDLTDKIQAPTQPRANQPCLNVP